MKETLGRSGLAVQIFFISFACCSLYCAIFPVETTTFRMVHLGLIFALGFVVKPGSEKGGPWWIRLDLVLALLAVASIVHGLYDLDQSVSRSTLPEPADVFFCIVSILFLLELSRRVLDNLLIHLPVTVPDRVVSRGSCASWHRHIHRVAKLFCVSFQSCCGIAPRLPRKSAGNHGVN